MSMKAGAWPDCRISRPASIVLRPANSFNKTVAMLKPRQFLRALVALSAGVLSGFVSLSAFAGPPTGLLDLTHANVRAVMAVQQEVTTEWMRQPEVLGTAVGIDAVGNTSLVVYVDQDAKNAGEVIRTLPRNQGGVNVQVELTDKFRSMARP